MPNMTPRITMLSVTPSAPPTRPSVPAAAAGSGVKKSVMDLYRRESRKPNTPQSVKATATSARPDSTAPTHPIDADRPDCGCLGGVVPDLEETMDRTNGDPTQSLLQLQP